MKKQLIYLALLCVLAVPSLAFGQTTSPDQATMLDSFGSVPNGDLRGRLDLFLATLQNQPKSKGLVYVHGTPAQISARTRLVQNHIGFRRFDPSRVAFIPGRNVGAVRLDLWIVPSGAPDPEIKIEAWIFREFGPTTKAATMKTMSDLDKEARKLSDHQSYIINYGTPAQIAQREKWIRAAIPFHSFDALRITLVNGGPGPGRTVIWLVPPGAENPTP